MESSHFPAPIHTQAPLLSLPAPVGTFVSMMSLQDVSPPKVQFTLGFTLCGEHAAYSQI